MSRILPLPARRTTPMRTPVAFIAAAFAALAFSPAHATDVGVSVTVGQPGFYGRIDIGTFPPPPVIYPRPVVIAPHGHAPAPVYMRVPPGHARDWGKHCRKYDACGVPVLFVQDAWYQDVYAPRVRGGGDDDRGRGNGHGHGKGRGRGHD
jgi:hypothetical protein